ncbi:hypothetical protein BDY24DRAFT_399207 [Mrakia frigida]|uniref:uncharacterized protein n=1 Tax=Mrakia frigida TaxID=29902 RepID=UPI003FCC0997
MQVFLTESKGWGLRCEVALPPRYYLGLYAGRLYDAETLEAIENAKPHGAQSAYIWELDEIEGDSEGQGLLLDAEEEGNFTRFFNHSCDASVTAVTIIRRDLEGFENKKVPLIGFVTNRSIPAGEELTLNYRGRDVSLAQEDVSAWASECRCEAWNCLGRLKHC